VLLTVSAEGQLNRDVLAEIAKKGGDPLFFAKIIFVKESWSFSFGITL